MLEGVASHSGAAMTWIIDELKRFGKEREKRLEQLLLNTQDGEASLSERSSQPEHGEEKISQTTSPDSVKDSVSSE
jgi:hypothetical protein